MEEEVLLDILKFYSEVFSAVFIPLATFILGWKLFKERKSTGRWNYIRIIIFNTFLCFAFLSIIEYFVTVSPIATPSLKDAFYQENFGGYYFFIGLMVSLGLILIFYINKWEVLYFAPLYFFGGMCVFYLFTGFYEWLDMYIKLVGIINIVFLYFTAFRVKDNGALGVAVFFSLAFSVIIIEEMPFVIRIIMFSYIGFIIFFSLGYFKPFNQEVMKNE